ncbi:restriction endonuclease subunit S [Enterococcus cecorum]|uniref:restriction endonuclease subunit S n=1 Tax=Enterococcus cecorum TaxID=44008 RepID=UPI002ACA9CC6|nr:restriction endonuclease subunit S [Enterococcus cecorum]MDZ5568860.1 restriction endonuclease subunit S [Enterococcus cecorum]
MNEKKKLQPKVRFREFTGENALDWEQRKLGDMASIGSGRDYKHLSSGNIPVYGTGGYMLSVNEYLSDKDAIGIGRKGTIDKPYILNAPFWTVDTLFFVVPKNQVDLQYLFSVFQKIYWKKYDESTGVPSLSKQSINNITIYSAFYEEQKRIGKFVGKLEDLITLHQRKLEQLEQLKNTLLSKMFPKSGTNIPEIRFSGFTDAWKQRKLGEVVIRLDNLRIPITESNRVSGPTPYYGANGIQDYVEGYTHDGEYILIAEDGANDTNNYPIFRVHGKIWVNNHAHVLQTIDDIADNDYVAYALKSINIGPYLVGGSRSKLNADSLMKLEIKLPKLSEQIKVGQIFVKIDYQIKNYKQKLKNLKTIKKSLLNKLFI